MRRFLFITPPRSLARSLASAVPIGLIGVVTAATALLVGSACSTTESSEPPLTSDDSGPRKDGGLVGPADGGIYDTGTTPEPEPSCSKYCDLVTDSCADAEAQYASRAECLEVCARLPAGDAGDIESNTVACRQYYAGSQIGRAHV